jgi:hypothetical protein
MPPPPPDAGHAGLAAAERMRRVRDALGAGELLDATDAGWLARGLERYLTGAAAGVKLEDALGVAVPPGGSPWWSERRRAERDAAIRELAVTFPGSTSARALATAEALRRYGSAAWRLDHARGGPLGGDARRKLLFAVFAADEDPPTGTRRVYDIITA